MRIIIVDVRGDSVVLACGTRWLDVLTKDDAHAVDVIENELADAIRLIGWPAGNVRARLENRKGPHVA